jgi:hypothetical protein
VNPTQSRHRPLEPAARRPRDVAFSAPAAPGGTREKARRRLVQLVFAIYLLAIVEGALRKWVAPQAGAYLFFLRDPVLVVAYLLATRHALWPRHSMLLHASLAMAAFGVLLFALQAATGGHSEQRLLLGVYGWRSYFLYLPLAPLVGAVFTREDLLRIFKLTLWLAIPIGVLVAAQFFSPLGAPINVGTADDTHLQFRGLTQTGERTRPMGPFASGAAQQQFVATAFAILLAGLIAPRHAQRPGFATLLLTGAGVLTCIAMSGSRGTVLQCLISVLAAMSIGAIGRGGALKARAVILPLVVAVGALMLYPIVFPEGHDALTERWTAADKAESRMFEGGIAGRALFALVDFVLFIDLVPMLGFGLGFGGNASITLSASIDGVKPGFWVETDFARHMVDLGPIFGMGYIVFRIALVVWLARKALGATRAHADPTPMLLLSYAGVVVFSGQITGQGTINFFGWLFTGLLIASCDAPGLTRRTPPAAVLPARRTAPARRPRLAPGRLGRT